MQSFVKIKSSRMGEITLSFTDMSKSCPNRIFFYIANMSFSDIRKNRIMAKISEFTVFYWNKTLALTFFVHLTQSLAAILFSRTEQKHTMRPYMFCLFDLTFIVIVNFFSVISKLVYLG